MSKGEKVEGNFVSDLLQVQIMGKDFGLYLDPNLKSPVGQFFCLFVCFLQNIPQFELSWLYIFIVLYTKKHKKIQKN